VLFVLTSAEWAEYWHAGLHDIKQANGEIMRCPPAFSIFIHGWGRAWMFVYFNSGVRDSLLTLVKVFSKLGPIFALLVVFYIGFFFVAQALAIGVSSGPPFGPGGDLGDALYNFFGLLTTVNHPDTLMAIVDEKWYTYLFILAYMFVTNIIGLNLLLAVVYGEYSEILADRKETKAKLRSQMLDTAFDILAEGDDRDYISMDMLSRILRKCSGTGEGTQDDNDFTEMIVRLIDVDLDDGEGGDDVVQDHQIDRQDLHELIVFYTAPIALKPPTQCEYRFEIKQEELKTQIQTLEAGHRTDEDIAKIQELTDEIDLMQEMGEDGRRWAATFPCLYWVTFKTGANWPDWECLKEFFPYHGMSGVYKFHTFYFVFYLIWTLSASSSTQITPTDCYLLVLSAVIQTFFVVFAVLGESRWLTAGAAWHYFNPESKRSYANWTNFLLLICLWFEFFSMCSSDSCFKNKTKDSEAMLVISANTIGKIMQVLNFAVETPSVLLLIKSIVKTIPTLVPHFGLFLAIYYGFSGMAISFFCGKCLEHPDSGGPGYWGQGHKDSSGGNPPATSVSPASGTPWSDTAYGGNPYYYNLNYDGFPNAIMSLYVVMIQNNWNVAANGPIEVTNKYFRWFFVIYTVFVAWIMINVLVGAIIDSLDGVRKEAILEASGVMDPLEAAVSKRLEVTKAPSGRKYNWSWELGDMPLHGEVRDDAALCEGLMDIDGVVLSPEEAEQKQDILWLRTQLDMLKAQNANLQESNNRLEIRACGKPGGWW